MASALEKKQIDELLAKYEASAVRKQRRVEELERQNKNLLAQISSSLIVPATAFGMSYARARYGDEASSICGMPIDATVGLALTMFATLLDCSSDEEAQTAAKFLHDFGNGALASWSASLGAEFGAKKRMERPVIPPRNTGEDEPPTRAPRQMTRAELDEAVVAMRWKAQLAMPERTPALAAMPQFTPLPIPVSQTANPLPTAEPVAAQAPALNAPLPRPHAPPPAPLPLPVQQKANPLPTAKPEAVQAVAPAPAPSPQSTTPPTPSLNERATPVAASAKSEAAHKAPSALQTRNCAAEPCVLDPEAEMRRLLQSQGAASDPKTVAFVLMHKNPIKAYRQIVERVRAPATSKAQKPLRVTKPWVIDPEAEMGRLLQSHGAASDPKTVEYVLMHENPIEAFRAIVRGAQVPATKVAAANMPTPAPVLQSSTPPQSPLNAPPATKKKPRRSLAAGRTVGITEAAVTASPQMPPKPEPRDLPKQFAQESTHSVRVTQEELEAAERWRLLTAA